MADAALFISWGPAVYGREQQALALFGEAMTYYGQLQERGEIASFEPIVIEPHGGALVGCLLIRGEREYLDAVRASGGFGRITKRALLLVTHYRVVDAHIGEGLVRWFAGFREEVAQLP
ncbi:MAG TPA: hypothetical protein VIC60_08310 [Thermomicrobiales bacterium]|jgi:hypothetical protein